MDRLSDLITLESILTELQAISANKNHDFEVTHDTADALLCDVVKLITPKDKYPIVNQILAAYHNVGKWYA